jgi:hypothetical protein
LIPPVRRHHGHSYARHGGCRRRRRDRRDRVCDLIPLRARRFRGVGFVEAGPAATIPARERFYANTRPARRGNAPLRQTGSTAGPVFVSKRLTARAERLALAAPSKGPREGTSIGVAAPASVLQVSVRGRLVAPARLFRFLGRGITGARRLLAFALFPIVASAELCCLLVGQDVLASWVSRNITRRAAARGSARSSARALPRGMERQCAGRR